MKYEKVFIAILIYFILTINCLLIVLPVKTCLLLYYHMIILSFRYFILANNFFQFKKELNNQVDLTLE